MEGLRYYIRREMSSFDRTAVQLQRDSVNCTAVASEVPIMHCAPLVTPLPSPALGVAQSN